MLAFFRLLQIIKVFIKYRLDTFLIGISLPLRLRLLVAPFSILPLPKTNRGKRLREALEELGPIFIKLGQLLSTRPDLIPSDMIDELKQLQDQVPPFDSKEFSDIVESAFGESTDSLFKTFDQQPLASASVAQVHCATLHNGSEVVVKVIRPGIERIIEKDIALMQLIAKLVESRLSNGKRFRPVEVIEEYRYTIYNELDLQREAANATQLRRNFAQSEMLYVPTVYWDLVRSNVMVMERIKGVPVTDIDTLNANNTNMKLLAERGVDIFFTQVFEHNFFHADMHPGNIFVDISDPEKPSYIAVDMAIVSSLNQEDQFYLARNLLAMFRRDYRMVAELHVISGWVKPDTNISEFEAAIRTVCEPIFEKPLKEISFGQVLITLFQTAAQFEMTVQPQLVLLQKTLLNIEGLGRQLYPDLDLWTTAHPYLEKWLKNRFHPNTLFQQLKRYGPEWMEKFPQVPNLIFNGLQQINKLDSAVQTIQDDAEQLRHSSTSAKLRRLAGILAIGAGVIIGWPALSGPIAQLPSASILLFAVGALAWLMR
ncbi:MAG: ubiquinone biosynthesis regulatory protein kinase UbiB [Cellvibrionaceae bacterium]